MPPKFNLTRLVADLLQRRDLRQEFNRRPLQVMDDYNLDQQERCILYSMNPATIAPHVAPPVDTQVQNFNIPQGEYHPEDEHCLPEPGAGNPAYPVPRPALFRVRPRVVEAVHVYNGLFELIVYGQTFSRNPNAMVRLVDPNTGNATDGQAIFVFGSMRCSRARAVFPHVPGSYEVRLFNCPGAGDHEAVNRLSLQVN